MDQTTLLGISVVGGFAVGVVVGRLTKPTPSLDCMTPQSRTIRVSANGTLDCPKAKILRTQQVSWAAPLGMTLNIVFTPPSPFPALVDQGNMSDSGPVGPNVFAPGDPSGTEKEFVYTVRLNGAPTNQEGRIIIKK